MSDNFLAAETPSINEQLCFSCGLPMPADEKFCERCHTPIGALMSSDPLQTAHQEGLLYARAIDAKRPKLIIVVCTWMLLFPIAVFAAIGAGTILYNFRQAGLAGGIGLLICLAVTYYLTKFLLRLIWKYLRKDVAPAADQ